MSKGRKIKWERSDLSISRNRRVERVGEENEPAGGMDYLHTSFLDRCFCFGRAGTKAIGRTDS